MSGKTSSTSTWLKFFRGAGIPTGIDTKYALLFDENRIKMDMLMDLDKEILKDVGIVAMGDIISILKHARKVHDETKEQAVETNKPTQSQSQSPIPSGVSGKAALESSVQPAFKVVSKVCVPVSSKPESKSTPGEATVKAKTASLLQQSIRMMERATQGKSLPTETVQKAVTQPAEIAERKMIVLNKRSSAESPLREEVPLQKKIRVLPEHEGKYKIKMPDGLIPRTQKVIQSRLGPSVSELASAKDKKNVFERLGESSVSSSTEDKQPLSSSTSSSSTRIESSNDNFSKLSVFERLGDRGRQGGSPKTPITLSSTVTKPLIQTKVYLPPHQTQTAAPPPKSRYDPKVYTEKTLTTIPSRISIPYLNKARVKSEIIAPSASSSTTTTRVISAKTSATSTTSQSQTKIMVGHEKEVIHQQRLEQNKGTDEAREVNIILTKQKSAEESNQPVMGTQRIKSQIVALPAKSYCKVDLASKVYNSEKDVFMERKISENYKLDVLQREAFRADIGSANNVKMLSTVSIAKERNEYKRNSPDKAQRRNDLRDERRYWEMTGDQINDERNHEKRQMLKYKSDVKEEKGLQNESTKSKVLIPSKSKQSLKEDHNVQLDLSHSTCRQKFSNKREQIVYSSICAEKMVRRGRIVEEKHQTRKRKTSCSDSSTEDSPSKTARINPKLSCEREERFYRNKESRSDSKPYDSECLKKISRTNPKFENISKKCKKESACANASHIKRDSNSVKKISRTNPNFEKTFENQSKGILCGTTSLLKRDDDVGKISRTNPELEKKSAKFHDKYERDIPSTVTSSSHAKLDDAFRKQISQNNSESGKTPAKVFEILKEIPCTSSSQSSSQKLMCEQLVIFEDRSSLNASQRQQTSKDSNIEQVVKYENNSNACGKCSLETCETKSLKGHMCDKYFKQTYLIINEKYGTEAATSMKSSASSCENVHYKNIVDLVTKEDMSICLNITNDKYQVAKAEDDNSESALMYSEYKRNYEGFHHNQADNPVKSEEYVNVSYDPQNSRCSKSQPMFKEKEAHPKNYTQRKDQNKKQYNENRAAFDYSNTFVRENNVVQYNFSGEEIIRIARPPSDTDGYVPDDKSMKMMAKMGWSPGRGLGKHNQGRKSAIENGKVRLNNLGLGFGRK